MRTHDLITSQRPHHLIPSHWELAAHSILSAFFWVEYFHYLIQAILASASYIIMFHMPFMGVICILKSSLLKQKISNSRRMIFQVCVQSRIKSCQQNTQSFVFCKIGLQQKFNNKVIHAYFTQVQLHNIVQFRVMEIIGLFCLSSGKYR